MTAMLTGAVNVTLGVVELIFTGHYCNTIMFTSIIPMFTGLWYVHCEASMMMCLITPPLHCRAESELL